MSNISKPIDIFKSDNLALSSSNEILEYDSDVSFKQTETINDELEESSYESVV